MVTEFVSICKALRKWMSKVDEDLSQVMDQIGEVEGKATRWQTQSAGNEGGSRHLFPFAALQQSKSYQNF